MLTPKLFLDAFESVKTTETNKLVIGNINPTNEEKQVSTALTLTFDVLKFTIDDITGLNTTIIINGISYTASLTSIDIMSYWRRYSLVLALATDTVYSVEIEATLGVEVESLAYSFTTMDTIQPQITGVLVDDLRKVWVGFSEIMDESTIITENLEFLKQINFDKSVYLSKISTIVKVEDTQVKNILGAEEVYFLELEDDLTVDGKYFIKASNVYDKNSNIINPLFSSFDFTVLKPYYWNENRSFDRYNLVYPKKWRNKDTEKDLLKLDSVLEALNTNSLAKIDKLFFELNVNFTTIDDFINNLLIYIGMPDNWLFWFTLEQKRRILFRFNYYKTRRGTNDFVGFVSLVFERDIEILRFPETPWLIGKSNIGYDTIVDSSPDTLDRFAFGVRIVDTLEINDDIINKITVLAHWWKSVAEHFKGILIEGSWILGETKLGDDMIL